MIDKDLLMEVIRSARVSSDNDSTCVEIDCDNATCSLQYQSLELVSMTVKRSE